MKRGIITIAAILMMAIPFAAHAEELSLETYISGFDYKARKEMKINSESLVSGLEQGFIQLVDIRFKEETAAWRMGFGRHIPLNELPSRLDELDKDKIIVTACPHKDRAILAMAYLRTKDTNPNTWWTGFWVLLNFCGETLPERLWKSLGKTRANDGNEDRFHLPGFGNIQKMRRPFRMRGVPGTHGRGLPVFS